MSSRRQPVVLAYFANQYPSPVEPYVGEEIRELMGEGVGVVACSLRPTRKSGALCLIPPSPVLLVRALWLCARRRQALREVWQRILSGREPWGAKIRALGHTVLGMCFALALGKRGVQQIHAHHGYAASWVAMVAARMLQVPFSFTLHGSDLLLDAPYLDLKLKTCALCFTVSEYNRKFLLTRFPEVNSSKVVLQRMGVSIPSQASRCGEISTHRVLRLLAVGRLHPVKNHAFLLDACKQLKDAGEPFRCLIAGSGPELGNLERQLRRLKLEDEVQLLGHVQRERLRFLYRDADVVVLTSRSEGIPLTLMEAMAEGRPVLAPAITGVPELVRDGITGFLFEAGSIEQFTQRLCLIRRTRSGLGPLRQAAREHVRRYFSRETNLRHFRTVLLERLARQGTENHAGALLQQVQLSIQRDGSLPAGADEADAGAGP